jgi:SAM-dependent methyltransferase
VNAHQTPLENDRVIFGAPKRRRGVEYLDHPDVAPDVRERAQRDVVRSNTLFGGRRAALLALAPWLSKHAESRSERVAVATMIDVGTGLADLPQHMSEQAGRHGVAVHTIGVDGACTLLATARRAGRIADAVCGDALALPFADRSVDVVFCSQLLHHFEHDNAVRLLRELHRVARRCVIVSDLRRSWIAVAGYWLSSFVLRFHPVTRHDGVVSILRGFTEPELRGMVLSATDGSVRPAIRRRLGFRVTASWAPLPRS